LVIFQKKVPGLTEGALNRFVMRARRAARLQGNVHILVTGNSAMRVLNLRFRGYNKATDVLSFPSCQTGPGTSKRTIVGEIAISADMAAQNAMQLGHSAATEVKVLVLHGILHLAGMDHERDNGQMARKEANLRRLLKLPVALIERAQPANPVHANSRLRKTGRTA
jgi:probable rRNA maturation factor